MRQPVATAGSADRLGEAATAGSRWPAPVGGSAARLVPQMLWTMPMGGSQHLRRISRRLKDGCQRPLLSDFRIHSAWQVAAELTALAAALV